jgi:hypothetical protein
MQLDIISGGCDRISITTGSTKSNNMRASPGGLSCVEGWQFISAELLYPMRDSMTDNINILLRLQRPN